jgi:hypothetical protein
MSNHVAAGSESFRCELVAMPSTAGWIVGASHHYTPGSHHMLLYKTDLQSIPPGADQPADCYEGGSQLMADIRGVVYGGQQPDGSYQAPRGVGLRYAANEVLLLQVHYLNASNADADTDLAVTLDTTDQGVTTDAGVLFYYDPFIDVPAGAKATAQMRCVVPAAVTLLTLSPHFHSRGVGYAAYLDDADGTLAPQPFYTSTDWQHPATLAHPLSIAAGRQLRFECDYDNTGGTAEYLQGFSATSNEMCMLTGLYYPAMGEQAEFCFDGADRFGSGPATCAQTLACTASCPVADKPDYSTGAVGPCWQRCIVSSCPAATEPLFPVLDCQSASCASECAHPASSACAACTSASCSSQSAACSAQVCAQSQ